MCLILPAFGCALLLLVLAPLEAETPGAFAQAFQPYLENHTLSGAVCLVATRDKILAEEALGFADLEGKEPMRPDAEFWIASDTKPMTATAFMMLVDEGKVSPDDERLKYPLDGKDRYPMPGGGLFSNAADMLKFARMILNGGVSDGRRYLSEASLREMTQQHTTAATGGTYGFGWGVGPDRISHNGSDSTRLSIDRTHGMIEIFLVQFAGSWPLGTPDMKNVFNRTAPEIARKAQPTP